MKQKSFFLLVCLTLWAMLALPEPSPTTAAVPAGLTPADWAHIQSQLSPQAVTAWNQQAQLTADDAATNDQFGVSVAVNGDTAVVGSYLNDEAGNNNGAAYVFVRTGESWSQQAKLTASDSADFDNFGSAVAISGDTAVVGAYGDDDEFMDSGAAYVFVRSEGVWSQQTKLVASDPGEDDNFGHMVAISGNTALVGGYLNDDAGMNSGSVYVFVRSGVQWSEQAKLTASDAAAGDEFGNAVAIDGDTAVIGARLKAEVGAESGVAYVFGRSGGSWSEQAKLMPNDLAVGDRFGWAVAIGEETIVASSAKDNAGGTDSGSAYVFVRHEGGWIQQAKLMSNTLATNDQFGWSVAVSGDTALVGAYLDDEGGIDASGATYVFTFDTAQGYRLYLPLLNTSPTAEQTGVLWRP